MKFLKRVWVCECCVRSGKQIFIFRSFFHLMNMFFKFLSSPLEMEMRAQNKIWNRKRRIFFTTKQATSVWRLQVYERNWRIFIYVNCTCNIPQNFMFTLYGTKSTHNFYDLHDPSHEIHRTQFYPIPVGCDPIADMNLYKSFDKREI